MLYNSRRVITLARKLRLVDYFALGWGTMVGVGWLVVMDDWLLRGGVLGAILGFAIGGALLLPIGYVYGRLVAAMPDAAGEVAYTAKVFPQSISFATGWIMILAYFIVCPWEAVAVGRIAGYILPALGFDGTLSHCWPAGLLAALVDRTRSDRVAYRAELSRNQAQRHISELDRLRNAGIVRIIRRLRSEQGFAAKFSASLYP